MSRYTGPVCRLCRREGLKLFLKGTKCTTPKCPVEKRGFPPGQHGQARIKMSNYGLQLREKQKVKRMYGMRERQFRFFFSKAQKVKGVTGEKLLELLERRIDNVVYRIGWASSRSESRQMVLHGWVRVNDKKVDAPAYQVRPGDRVAILASEAAAKKVKATLELTKDRTPPSWITIDQAAMSGTITRLPAKSDVGMPLQESLIVELYSK